MVAHLGVALSAETVAGSTGHTSLLWTVVQGPGVQLVHKGGAFVDLMGGSPRGGGAWRGLAIL
jgi:hypothetical protein